MTACDQIVTVTVGRQLFGLPIARVQDVFKLHRITPVPLAAEHVAGIVNLRGRLITVIDLRRRLAMAGNNADAGMAVGIEYGGESYGLMVDAVGDVVSLDGTSAEPVPVNLDARLKDVASAVHRLPAGLLVMLDVERLLDLKASEWAA